MPPLYRRHCHGYENGDITLGDIGWDTGVAPYQEIHQLQRLAQVHHHPTSTTVSPTPPTVYPPQCCIRPGPPWTVDRLWDAPRPPGAKAFRQSRQWPL
eukprot:2164189-Prymnesium_polylepis.2